MINLDSFHKSLQAEPKLTTKTLNIRHLWHLTKPMSMLLTQPFACYYALLHSYYCEKPWQFTSSTVLQSLL